MTTSNVNEQQVGGDHYKKVSGRQHWDFMWERYGPAWFIGNITKYVERAGDKNGLEDLKKAAHYLCKYTELVEAWRSGTGPPPGNPSYDKLAPPEPVPPKADEIKPGTLMYHDGNGGYTSKPSTIVVRGSGLGTYHECTCPTDHQTPTGTARECNLCGKKESVS